MEKKRKGYAAFTEIEEPCTHGHKDGSRLDSDMKNYLEDKEPQSC